MNKKPGVAAAILLATALYPLAVHAEAPGRVGTRALGMGGAGRAAATGDMGPMLNPSGMSLVKSYAVEGSYQLNDLPGDSSAHRAHASIVDSTPAIGLAGGLYYTFLSFNPPGVNKLTGHEAGLSLSLPIGTIVTIGATLKYLHVTTTVPSLLPAMVEQQKQSGFTTTVGTTVRPVSWGTIAVVGHNLIDRETALAPLAVGAGISLAPIPALLLVGDGVWDLESSKLLGGPDESRVSLMGGAEYLTEVKIAVRAGGGRDGVRKAGYLTVGASAISEVGAIDVALQRDVSGATKQTIFCVSARLFVPN